MQTERTSETLVAERKVGRPRSTGPKRKQVHAYPTLSEYRAIAAFAKARKWSISQAITHLIAEQIRQEAAA